MKNTSKILYIALAVAIALSANSVSALWAKNENRYSLWLLLLVVLSPFVFISFGLVTGRMGLAITSAVIDSLLTISTIIVGLVFFKEWDKISTAQYVGMAFAIIGIFLMIYFPKEKTI
jgi:multidrug transporter EmrE-like cation transporter